MGEKDFMPEEEVAKFLGITVKTLKNKRAEEAPDIHPPYIRVGVLTRYPRDAFFKWYMSQLSTNKVKAKKKAS